MHTLELHSFSLSLCLSSPVPANEKRHNLLEDRTECGNNLALHLDELISTDRNQRYEDERLGLNCSRTFD